MRTLAVCSFLVAAATAGTFNLSAQQQQQSRPNESLTWHWREIGPTRAGRARALAGVPSQPNVFYIGFDNGGVWRSTDYGSTWVPLFDSQSIGSIGAIAVSPSDPNIIYVGTGAGIIRPDLATGNGVYKSTDGGKTWTHLGLRESQMIAMIDVDPKNPDRIFVAALGHPYGPNAERGIFRSTDGGQTFTKVLYKDEYTSGNDVRIDPLNPNTVYATLWQQQQSFIEGGGFGGAGNGIYKSTDGGDHWTQLTDGLPNIIQANLGISATHPNTLYATAAGTVPDNGGRGGRGGGGANNTTGVVGFYKSTDGGAHWTKVGNDPRPLARIGGGDLPTIAVDPTNDNVVYSASTVSWHTEDGGQTWSALRGAPGGDDYQKIWVSPTNPNIILIVSDQGGVVSANRGLSWSNWYTQPTAAMYHVTIDNSFPFNVCGGQQDSGSACVASTSMDGEITFHDWHPVNIQEYGIAAPDPRDPDMVYGSARQGVSLYNRRTGQTTQVGPTAEQRQGNTYGRNVRTMPIQWSPVDNTTLFYASNVIWKSTDHAHSWTRISPDLTRQTWDVPPTAGKYASTVTPGPQGSITAMSPSPRSLNIIWTGSDDGTIEVTMDGGAHWANVTPPSVKPWARVFNIEAGHFDNTTAYAAVNTMRLDDMNPHFFRTHDGGKTWTEIDTGLEPGAVANSIREDPKKKGLLFAATETQVYVSNDDGDHWNSIKYDMPAISVRDIQIKDDSICLCSVLVAGTHGRGFWVLDNISSFRQITDVMQSEPAANAFLFKPPTAVRVRFATNDPTPWPPELLAGENPLPGGIIDYHLAKAATGPVTLEILDAQGKRVRHYTSADPIRDPHPALDPEAYNELCKRQPNAADCGLPLYWPAPPIRLGTRAGFHRFAWDLRYDQTNASDPNAGEDDAATGAVPHRTYAVPYAPWAPPGNYTVRLTVDGKTYTQPLTLKLDPRVKTPAAGLAQLASLTKEMYDGAIALHAAFNQARALASSVEQSSADPALKAEIDRLAPAPANGGRRGRGGFGGGGRGGRGGVDSLPSLETVSGEMINAAMAMQGADVTPTAGEIAAVAKARADAAAVMKRWNAVKSRAGK
ncbi:MAG TPA: hypothetical protein VN706_15615 [Gemmatimonadaceae bacterium]|nr:hypothetical protein [Gemmatimonadaceae bacterium]